MRWRATLILATALAASGALADDVPLGRVEAIYVRTASGVMLDQRLARSSGETWVDVRLAIPDGDRVIARIGNVEGVGIGDMVSLRRAETMLSTAERRGRPAASRDALEVVSVSRTAEAPAILRAATR